MVLVKGLKSMWQAYIEGFADGQESTVAVEPLHFDARFW